MHNYRILSKKGEGTFSEVMRAVHLLKNEHYAIKFMKKNFDSIEQVNKLFEIQALRKLEGHPHIVQLHEVLFENHRLAMVFELMDMNVYEAIKNRRSYLPEARATKWMFELFEAIHFIHQNQIFHRDVKPENLLIVDDVLKLADLGSCCALNERLPFTEYISTRWYRPPECLLTSGYYTCKMDIWASGCVFYELMTLNPLFPGKTEVDQINKIHAVLGSPSRDILAAFEKLRGNHLDGVHFAAMKGTGIARKLTHCSSDLVSFLGELLRYDPSKRPNASQVIRSSFFSKLRREQLDSRDFKILNSPASTSAPSSPPVVPTLPPISLSKRVLNPYGKTPRLKKLGEVLESTRSRHLDNSVLQRELPHVKLSSNLGFSFVLASGREYRPKLTKK